MSHSFRSRVLTSGLIVGFVVLLSIGVPTQAAGLSSPPAGPSGGDANGVVSLVLPITYIGQLVEPVPTGWSSSPYCVPAATAMVLGYYGVALASPPLATLFETGRAGNVTDDPGVDPRGTSRLLRLHGGEGQLHVLSSASQAVHELVGRLNGRAPAIYFTTAGNHAVTIYGYEAHAAGGVTALYVADPADGFEGRLPLDQWLTNPRWAGAAFSAPGEVWHGKHVFVTYLEAGPRSYHSRWVTQSAYPTLTLGARTTVRLTFRNTGTGSWVRGTTREVRLGTVGDDRSLSALGFGPSWPGSDRPAVQREAVVAGGEVATFSFEVLGASRGSYRLRLRPVVDGLKWLEDEGVFLTITVR